MVVIGRAPSWRTVPSFISAHAVSVDRLVPLPWSRVARADTRRWRPFPAGKERSWARALPERSRLGWRPRGARPGLYAASMKLRRVFVSGAICSSPCRDLAPGRTPAAAGLAARRRRALTRWPMRTPSGSQSTILVSINGPSAKPDVGYDVGCRGTRPLKLKISPWPLDAVSEGRGLQKGQNAGCQWKISHRTHWGNSSVPVSATCQNRRRFRICKGRGRPASPTPVR